MSKPIKNNREKANSLFIKDPSKELLGQSAGSKKWGVIVPQFLKTSQMAIVLRAVV
jgi:hypothetical protein